MILNKDGGETNMTTAAAATPTLVTSVAAFNNLVRAINEIIVKKTCYLAGMFMVKRAIHQLALSLSGGPILYNAMKTEVEAGKELEQMQNFLTTLHCDVIVILSTPNYAFSYKEKKDDVNDLEVADTSLTTVDAFGELVRKITTLIKNEELYIYGLKIINDMMKLVVSSDKNEVAYSTTEMTNKFGIPPNSATAGQIVAMLKVILLDFGIINILAETCPNASLPITLSWKST